MRHLCIAALGVAAASGCEPTTFECAGDDDCAAAGEDGVCEATGYCSFTDAACDSGRRYGEYAETELAGSCVTCAATGIPFGTWGVPIEGVGQSPFTAHQRSLGGTLTASWVVEYLESFEAAGQSTGARMVEGQAAYSEADGRFSPSGWRASLDGWDGQDVDYWIDNRVLIFHLLLGNPATDFTAPVALDDLETIAAHSKSKWPDLPTVVFQDPSGYLDDKTDWTALDQAFIEYLPADDGAIDPWLDDNAAAARRAGIELLGSINALNGGDGSSGIAGTGADEWMLSTAELLDHGRAMVAAPIHGLFLWEWNDAFFAQPGMASALEELAELAAAKCVP